MNIVLKELFERFLGHEADYAPQLYLSADDLRLCQDTGLEIGVHGHEHLTLSRLTLDGQRHDIGTAAAYFRQELGLEQLHFSYPYGAVGTWNRSTEQVLGELGFSSSVTKVRAITKPADLRGRWELPRFDVRDIFDQAGQFVPDRLATTTCAIWTRCMAACPGFARARRSERPQASCGSPDRRCYRCGRLDGCSRGPSTPSTAPCRRARPSSGSSTNSGPTPCSSRRSSAWSRRHSSTSSGARLPGAGRRRCSYGAGTTFRARRSSATCRIASSSGTTCRRARR